MPAQMTGLDSTQLIGGGACGCNNTTSDGHCTDVDPGSCFSFKNKAVSGGSGTVKSQTYCTNVVGCQETGGTYCD